MVLASRRKGERFYSDQIIFHLSDKSFNQNNLLLRLPEIGGISSGMYGGVSFLTVTLGCLVNFSIGKIYEH